jgi:hypothetical protein
MILQLKPGKQIALLLLFACLVFKLSRAQDKWNKTYIEDRPIMVFGSIVYDDTCYKIAGGTYGYMNNIGKTLIGNISLTGDLTNYKIVVDSINESYGVLTNALIRTNQGKFAFTGFSYDSVPYLFFGVANKNLDSIFAFRYFTNNTFAFHGYSLLQLYNDYYIAGIRSTIAPNNADVILAKIDSSGNRLWEKTYGTSQYEEAKSITDLANGNLLIGAVKRDLNQTHEHSNTWLLEVDTGGTLVRQWFDPNDSTYAAEGLLQTRDGGFIYGAQKKSVQTINDVNYIASIVKLDSTFNKQWMFTGGYAGMLTGLFDIEELAGGNIIACGKSDYYHGWIVKLSAAGQLLWEREYVGFASAGSENYLTDIDVLPDGSLIAVGQCQQSGSTPPQVGWFLKLDSNGCELESCLLGVEEMPKEKLNTQLQINPNPFTGNLSLTSTNANGAIGSANITLTNPLGQTVYHQQVTNLSSSYTKTIDLSYLPSGVYFLAVEADGERIVKQVVKQ